MSDIPALTAVTNESLSLLQDAEGFVLPMLKETGYSSGFFVNQLRKRLSYVHRIKRFKLGHAGTLDPFAEGVLVLLGGRAATRQQATYMKMPKRYRARVKFGAITPSLDPATEVSERDEGFVLDPSALPEALNAFRGEFEQMPPIFSAKKVDGQRAYKLARKGEEVELKPSTVRLDTLELIESGEDWADIDMVVGSGFYVRALARDIAEKLGTLGYLETLVRTECGGFKLDQCVPLREALDAVDRQDEEEEA